ncbi:hypothetical protein WAF17_15440 [Bernardetia sp. ABR2-2B]|uniref:hypothetical protein n=1 Tax=Bernardetia sp. ABR2-2B TaxID=3127472 RepID=UPI0030D5A023
MKNILILFAFSFLFSLTYQAEAQDYFKERRYEGIDFNKAKVKKQYITISRRKYEVVKKEEEVMLGKKFSYDSKQRVFYVKRQKKAMTFQETINFMKYVGNQDGAAGLRKSLVYHYAGVGATFGGYFVAAGGVLILVNSLDSSNSGAGFPYGGLAFIGAGGLLYGGGYLLNKKGDNIIKKTIRYHNKKVRKFSKPVIVKNDFMPSSLGFKSVRTNLLNPTPVPALSLGWSF